MQKFFVENEQIEDKIIRIIGNDVNHISNVLRMKKTDKIQIGNKETSENYIAEIKEMKKNEIIAIKIEEIQENSESNVKIDLYQGLPKADKMELIIQKTTEIGIDKIIPIDMVRCVVKLDSKEEKKKIERWQKIAEVAAKQSKRGKIPEIKNKIKIKELADKINEYDIFLVAYEEENINTLKQELKKIETKKEYKIGILVGPEGGIAKEEINMLKEIKAKTVTLGKRILRTETAPIVIVSNILYELEN
ncbi:MAG: 16S rRNA (uracil(1498)-N(3))-methyltransferase [Clostridiaceae bacterium]|nr:16S rRNA (uracil(1498)-N(3))-methyltransferase [Clostridiaceae bacterium]